MSKAFFRFLRGELNGFYITALNNTLNKQTEYIKQFLFDMNRQQFESGMISNENLYGLGKFASIFLPRRPVSESRSAVYMTDSHEVDGIEFSERGLFNTDTELFDFEHTDENITSPDINTLASPSRRSSLVGDEAVAGYIPSDATDVLDDNGEVRPEKVEANPPANQAYSDFYGNQFSFLAEGNIVYESLPPSLFIELFKTLQWVRYNGCSMATLTRIAELLCPDKLVVIHRISVAESGRHLYIHYSYDPTVTTVTNKEQRLALFQYLVGLKFKQTMLIEEE